MIMTLQLVWLLVLSLPIACIAWTVTHEEVFREPREYCKRRSEQGRSILERKFFYLFTCEYCFSHYVAAAMLALTGFRLLLDDWRGILIALFALVWIANVYMGLFALIRIDLKVERLEADMKTEQLAKTDSEAAEKKKNA
ncbi:MAG: hypothetical protein IAF08_12970 [Rhizobacter sp.]|nr:hypothetical protein [Chlorobiales bacterium]